MTAKTRPHVAPWNSEYKAELKSPWSNLLVSGCSFTDNISMTETVTWPWYLKTLMDFDCVYDCSQSGSGNNHIFNSIVNECETNPAINGQSTLAVIMWSGWSRADAIGHKHVTQTLCPISNYEFSENYATLSLFRNSRDNKTEAEKLCVQYARVVEPEAQIYESCLKIIGLKNYLENKKIPHVFVSWKPIESEYDFIADPNIPQMAQQIKSFLAPIPTLDEYAHSKHLQIADGHPSTEAHLRWSRNVLMPYLIEFIYDTKM